MKAFCAWCYPNGTNGPMHEFTIPEAPPPNSSITSSIAQMIGGNIAPMPPSAHAVALANTHLGDCTIPGAGLWCGYGETQPDTYWLYASVPL